MVRSPKDTPIMGDCSSRSSSAETTTSDAIGSPALGEPVSTAGALLLPSVGALLLPSVLLSMSLSMTAGKEWLVCLIVIEEIWKLASLDEKNDVQNYRSSRDYGKIMGVVIW